MKKPKFHKKSHLMTFLTVLCCAVSLACFIVKKGKFSGWEPLVIVSLVSMGLGLIFMFSELIVQGKEEKVEGQWYWSTYKDHVVKTKLNWVGGKKPTANDLDNPKYSTKFEFSVIYDCDVKWHEVEVDGGDPDIQLLIDKITNFKLSQDRHIRKTQILAVNNDQIVDTQQRVSIAKALIGGLIAGEAGFIIGGLSGSSTSIVRNGPNTYTFLVVYDDRPPVTETATEGSKRFQFLITKLEV